jgi:Ras-related protein Rab-6A
MYENLNAEEVIKIVLLGESGVGKTNLINVSIGKEFQQNSDSSLSSSFVSSDYKVGNKVYTYVLWDTAGQESYRSLNKIFIKNTKVVIFVYSIENYKSFQELDYWVNIAKEELGDNSIYAIIGNKSDLYDEQEVKDEEAEKYAEEHNMKIKFTSALADAKGVKSFLNELISDYIKTIDPEYIGENVEKKKEKTSNVKLVPIPKPKKEKKKWC